MKEQVQARVTSKTYWLGFVFLALTFTQDNFGLINQYLGEWANLVNYAVGFLILFVRELTTKPLSEKVKDPNVIEP